MLDFFSFKSKYVLFADDINILYSNAEPENIEDIVSTELHLFYAQLCTINLSKTNFMIFSKLKRSRISKIHINNHQIEMTDYVKFLGVPIDSCLEETYKLYFNILTVSFLIYKASSIQDCNSLKILCMCLCYTHFDYCCEIWRNKLTMLTYIKFFLLNIHTVTIQPIQIK